MTQSGDKPAVTIYEIAEHVGLSPAAVSSVLANRHVERRIAPATVRRIREAIEKLGYVPNMAGRRLSAHRATTRQIDLAVLTSFEAPLPLVGQALYALQHAVDARAAKNTRYSIVIEMFHAGRLREMRGLLEASRYHAVILTNTLPADDRFLATVKLPYEVVILGRRIANQHCVLEKPDFVGRRAAEALIKLGCRSPIVLSTGLLTQATADRTEAFKRVVGERLGGEPVAVVSAGLEPAQARRALADFFGRGGRCDGLFAVTDSLAVGAYQALRRAGLRIPDDVAVVGIGDYETAEFFDPPLSTFAGANDAMVAEAVPLLFRLLRGEKDVPREILVVPRTILRGSTRGARAAKISS